jgi:hypothetical protein
MNAQIQAFFSRLERQSAALNRIRNNAEIPLSTRVRARLMARHARALQGNFHFLTRANDRLIQDADALLARLRQAGRVRVLGSPYDDTLQGLQARIDRADAEQQDTLARSVLAANQALIDRYNRGQANQANQAMAAPQPQPLYCGSASGAAWGAMASQQGVPDAVNTYRRGYQASPQTQARFFENGEPIEGNLHHRRYTFSHGGVVDIQAHQSQRTHTDRSNAAVVVTALGGAAVGAFSGMVSGGMLASMWGAVGAVTAAVVAHRVRPHDAAWQGYSAHYYASATDKTPWGQQFFYGWKRSPHPHLQVEGANEANPAGRPNFADDPQNVSWWAWHTGTAHLRTPELLYTPALSMTMASRMNGSAGDLAPPVIMPLPR